jgi:putative component of toxin-antitoxin plasmid stabilization module
MTAKLIQIPGIANHHQMVWQVRVLEIDGRNLVLSDLAEWSKKSPADYKKIMKVLFMVGQQDRIRDEKKVKKSKNHDGVYEIRADKGSARLMFFYDHSTQSAVVCTNTYWKTKTSEREQNNSFDLCARLKKIYEQQNP